MGGWWAAGWLPTDRHLRAGAPSLPPRWPEPIAHPAGRHEEENGGQDGGQPRPCPSCLQAVRTTRQALPNSLAYQPPRQECSLLRGEDGLTFATEAQPVGEFRMLLVRRSEVTLTPISGHRPPAEPAVRRRSRTILVPLPRADNQDRYRRAVLYSGVPPLLSKGMSPPAHARSRLVLDRRRAAFRRH
jgi:hypothetical protein